MGFWGIEVKPGKPHKYHSSDVEGTVYVTQATLGLGSAKEKCVLQCSSRDRSPVYLCSLLPDQTECCPLSLEFEDADDIVFSVVGSRSIHLAGKFVADEGHSDEDCYDSDSLGEDIADTETDDSNDYGSEDEYGGDFIDDDDTNLLPPSAVPNSGVTIEEIVDDDKPTNGNSKSKRPKKKNQINDSEENKKSQRQMAAKSSSGVTTVMESEDEDGFPICSSHKNDVTMQNPEAETEQIGKRTTEKTKKKKAKDSEERATSVKRKVEDADQDHQPEREPKEKKNKKKKQQKEQGEEEKANEAGDQPEDVKQQNLSQISSAGSDLDQKAMNGNEIRSEEKKKKKKKKNKTEGEDLTSKEITVSGVGDKGVSTMQVEEHNEPKSSQARTFGNGLVIEELTMGKPDGKRASPGRLVSVHYIGKLKKNGEVFDSNVGTTPFKFRLGVGRVIKGWDVGVNGMRVGDKRRLTIPPSMGYGAEGVGEKIPPNSWLVFDVELVDVR